MKVKIRIIPILLLSLITSYKTPKTISTIESNNYDEKTNLTTFNKFPLGGISMAGKWINTSYYEISRQHNFINTDSVLISVAINQSSSYPFYKPKMTSNDIAKEFYEWDSKYLADETKGNRNIITQDTINHFIVWRISKNNEEYELENYFLIGSENGIIFTLSTATTKWTNDQKIEYLVTVFNNKTVGTCCK